jgi:hypothetical protein
LPEAAGRALSKKSGQQGVPIEPCIQTINTQFKKPPTGDAERPPPQSFSSIENSCSPRASHDSQLQYATALRTSYVSMEAFHVAFCSVFPAFAIEEEFTVERAVFTPY